MCYIWRNQLAAHVSGLNRAILKYSTPIISPYIWPNTRDCAGWFVSYSTLTCSVKRHTHKVNSKIATMTGPIFQFNFCWVNIKREKVLACKTGQPRMVLEFISSSALDAILNHSSLPSLAARTFSLTKTGTPITLNFHIIRPVWSIGVSLVNNT